jgi:hypothetical protein
VTTYSFVDESGETRLRGTIYPAPGGSQVVQQSAPVTVTASEILNLTTTPKTLVAAPGAGIMLFPVAVALVVDWNSVAYSGTGSDAFEIDIGDVSGANSTMFNLGNLSISILAVETDAVLFIQTGAQNVVTGNYNTAPYANKPLQFFNWGDPVTDGNSPLVITTYYVALTLP